jgi:small-conductance mechanosensitive channel
LALTAQEFIAARSHRKSTINLCEDNLYLPAGAITCAAAGELMSEINAHLAELSQSAWVTVGLIVLLIALAHGGLKWWLARRARREERALAADASELARIRYWIGRGLYEAVPPLALMLWVHGLHFALINLLGDLPANRFVEQATAALHLLRGIGTVVALTWLLSRIGRTLQALLMSIAKRTRSEWDDVIAAFAGKALRLILPVLAIILAAPMLDVSADVQKFIQNASSMLLIGSIAIILLQCVNTVSVLILQRHKIDVSDNREARGVVTQVVVLRKIAGAVIGVFAIASMLMVFDSVRQFGTAIIASAGIAGIIIGFAAQKSIATLLAGFQIAITQPIRIDDVVIVENEWGRIEEITLTYVVVCIWDLRRLVLPITYFIEKPFENWTRTSADILGTVFLYTDYNVPLEAIRAELTRILESSPLWDKKANILQVTDSKESSVEIRALASARNASDAFDLRCLVREQLIIFLQQHHPDSLPRQRANVQLTS